MPQYKLLCKKKTVSHDVGTIAKVWGGSDKYWIDFCNINSDTWEFLGEEESASVKPPAAKPIVAKPIKYLNRGSNICL